MDDTLKNLLALGRGHYLRKEYTRAEKYLTQVVEQTQSAADVYNMLGVIWHDQGQFAKARRSFEQALRINPGYTEAALNLAVIYNDMGRYDEAREVYSAALSRSASNHSEMDPFVQGKISNMYADIGDAFASSGMWDEAIREYRNALDLCPDFVDIRMKLAAALRDKGDKDAAVEESLKAVESRPQYLSSHVALGVALYSAGRTDEAVARWEHVLDKSPGHKTAAMYLKLVRGGGALPEEAPASEDGDAPDLPDLEDLA